MMLARTEDIQEAQQQQRHHHQQISVIMAVIVINISINVQSGSSKMQAKLTNIKVIISFAFRISSLIIVATGYNPYNTHQTILAGIRSPDPRHEWWS